MRDIGLKSPSSRLLVHNPSHNNQRVYHQKGDSGAAVMSEDRTYLYGIFVGSMSDNIFFCSPAELLTLSGYPNFHLL